MFITLQGVSASAVRRTVGEVKWNELKYWKCNGSHLLLCFCVSSGTVNTHYFPIHYSPAGLRSDVATFVTTQELSDGMHLVKSGVRNLRCQLVWSAKFCTVAPNICGSSVLELALFHLHRA